MIYYTSDLHLFHDNAIRLCSRPYINVDEMNMELIQKWNAKVKKDDDVYILGDMFFKYKDIQQVTNILKLLNGKKHLVRGNHDKFLNAINYKDYFEEVVYYKEISDNNRMVILFHYPIEEWNGFYRNSYMLYGHVHGNEENIKKHPRKFNVSVDVNDFEPKTLDELIKINKTPCDCYHVEYGRAECLGTFERERCTCGGDESKCNFYPQQ